ncbi:MAG: pantetheine-phosphate adenylyltransferase [Sandaracinaceae bacterium]|nr:pantetheine-phosphate adenylyltransferase [Sandaracinaceae bacterium]
MTTAVYPGSFDPLTRGHVSIIRSGLVVFERIIVAVLRNPRKDPLFSVEERVEMIREEFGDTDRVEVDFFDGLLVDYCRKRKVRVVLRGLRAVADFEYELQMANMNRHLEPSIETVFIMANDAYFYVSSNLVKEAARLGGDVSRLVPDSVARRLREKLRA